MTNETNNPMCWVIMGTNRGLLGVYTRPEWAAQSALHRLEQEHLIRTQRAVQYKHQMPDGVYLLREGYDFKTGDIDLLYHPTLELITETINERSQSLGVTVVGIGSSTYALNICPIVVDEDIAA